MNQSATQPIAVTDGDFAEQVLQADKPVGVRPKADYESSINKAIA